MATGSKKARGFKKRKLARDDHARVLLGIPTAFFPIPHRFDPVRSLLGARFALYKGHFARNHLGESLGRSDDRRSRSDGWEPARNPKPGPGIEKLNQSRSYKKALDVTWSRSIFHQRSGPRAGNQTQQSRTGTATLARPGNQETRRLPRNVAQMDLMAHWGKIFQKDFEKFRKKIVRLPQADAKKVEKEIRDSASAYIALHWGKIFPFSRS
jgi:hypothetical protein